MASKTISKEMGHRNQSDNFDLDERRAYDASYVRCVLHVI